MDTDGPVDELPEGVRLLSEMHHVVAEEKVLAALLEALWQLRDLGKAPRCGRPQKQRGERKVKRRAFYAKHWPSQRGEAAVEDDGDDGDGGNGDDGDDGDDGDGDGDGGDGDGDGDGGDGDGDGGVGPGGGSGTLE